MPLKDLIVVHQEPNYDDIEKDRRIFSVEEAEEITTEPLHFPDHCERFYGADNINELRQILNSPVLTDLDLMALTGDINLNEVVEFLLMVDEARNMFTELKLHAQRVVAGIRPKIRHYTKGAMDDGKIQTGRLHKLLVTAINLPNEIRCAYGTALALSHFGAELLFAISRAISEDLQELYPDRSRDIIDKLVRDEPRSGNGLQYGVILRTSRELDEYLNGEKREIFQPLFDGDVMNEDEFQQLLRDVHVLSMFREIDLSIRRGNHLIEFARTFEGITSKRIENLSHICACKISSLDEPEQFIAFHLSRETGDIINGPRNFADIIGAAEARNLSILLHKILASHLRRKDEDMERARPTPLQPQITLETRGDIAEGLEPVVRIEDEIGDQSDEDDSEAIGFDRYALTLQQLETAIQLSCEHGGRIRMVAVESGRVNARLARQWDATLAVMGFDGTVEWLTLDELKQTSAHDVPLVVARKVNTHLGDGWKRNHKNVFVIDVSSPQLVKSYIENTQEMAKLDAA